MQGSFLNSQKNTEGRMLNRALEQQNNRPAKQNITTALLLYCSAALLILSVLFSMTDLSEAANIKVVPSATRVSPGENFYIDINVENIPQGRPRSRAVQIKRECDRVNRYRRIGYVSRKINRRIRGNAPDNRRSDIKPLRHRGFFLKRKRD